MMQHDPELGPAWGLFDPGNPGSYPGRVERVSAGDVDKELLALRATDDRGVSLITIVLSVKAGGSANTLKTPFCHLAWGVSGGRDEAIVDWLHGQAITVAGSYLRVAATYPFADKLNPPGFPPGVLEGEQFGNPVSPLTGDPEVVKQESILLGVSVAPMAHGGAAFGWSPRLTTFHTVPANGVSDFIPVPSHAQSVTLLGTFATGEISSIAAFTIPVAGAVLYQQTIPTPNFDQFAFPIARGVEFLQLANGTDQNVTVLMLWTIGL
jgi:hypothetical protein